MPWPELGAPDVLVSAAPLAAFVDGVGSFGGQLGLSWRVTLA